MAPHSDVFLADTLVGVRDFEAYRNATNGWLLDRVNHNSHLLVLRKRPAGPRTSPVSSHQVRSFLARSRARLAKASGGSAAHHD